MALYFLGETCGGGGVISFLVLLRGRDSFPARSYIRKEKMPSYSHPRLFQAD